MIKWKRIEAGDYVSEDERFHIMKAWNRLYGDYWQLHDKNNPDYHKAFYHERTLRDCKLKAEALLD